MATGTTVFSRVTVVAPRTRIDVALPADDLAVGVCFVILDSSGERTFVTSPGAEGRVRPVTVDAEDVVYVTGYSLTHAVNSRYDARKRNPYNEIECSDHYARAMMGYGVYLAACGYEHHGPRGHLGFAPRIRPEDFRAAFT
ncbi:hypothetical protein ACFQ1S_30760, partial [Kibdelosporangium lantanae]